MWPTSGLSLTPSLELEAPVSANSRAANRYVGLGTALSLVWSLNGFSLSYKPLITGFINGSSNLLTSTRQTRLMLKNTIIAKYVNNNHTIAATFRLYDAFLRPLSEAYLLTSAKTQEDNLRESTMGVLEYSYAIPMRFPCL